MRCGNCSVYYSTNLPFYQAFLLVSQGKHIGSVEYLDGSCYNRENAKRFLRKNALLALVGGSHFRLAPETGILTLSTCLWYPGENLTVFSERILARPGWRLAFQAAPETGILTLYLIQPEASPV